jgi:hypothetical protein
MRSCVSIVSAAADFSESEQRALFSPVGREPLGLAHQRLSIELVRLATIDNGGGDIGCQPGQPQQIINVGGGHTLLARDVVYGQIGILNQASLDIVRASDKP